MLVFDSRAAKLLKAGDHLTWAQAPGLRLVASASRRSWVYRFKSPVDGGMRQVKLGEWPVLSAGQAFAAWLDLRAGRSAGADAALARKTARLAAAAPPVAPAGPVLVGELCTQFVATYAASRRKPKGLAELRRTLGTMLGGFAAMPAQVVTRTAAYELIASHAGIPVQAGNLRRELGAVWDWALDSGRLPDTTPNWWRLILRGKLASKGKIVGGKHQGAPTKVVLSPTHVGVVLVQMQALTPLVRDLLICYLATGCRGAELCMLEGREVTDEPTGLWWTVPKAKLKIAKHPHAVDLRVPLVGGAEAVVRARLAAHGAGYLFPALNPTSKEPHVQQKVLGVAVWTHRPGCSSKPEVKRMRWAVPDWSPHDLRRTVRTQLSALGCPVDVAEAVLGHIQPGVQGVYNRYGYDTERRKWLSAVWQTWADAAGAVPPGDVAGLLALR